MAAGEFLADPLVTVLGFLSGDGLWHGSSQSGTARFSSFAWAMPSGSRRLPMKCGSLSMSTPSRMAGMPAAGFAAGLTPGCDSRWTAIAGFERRTKKRCDSGCWRERASPWATPRRPSRSPATGCGPARTRRSDSDRERTRRARVFVAALPDRSGDRPRTRPVRRRPRLGSARARGSQQTGGPVAQPERAGRAVEGGGATADDRHALTALVDGLPKPSVRRRSRERWRRSRGPDRPTTACVIRCGQSGMADP